MLDFPKYCTGFEMMKSNRFYYFQARNAIPWSLDCETNVATRKDIANLFENAYNNNGDIGGILIFSIIALSFSIPILVVFVQCCCAQKPLIIPVGGGLFGIITFIFTILMCVTIKEAH